jgi:hypothetical protein
MVQSSVTELIWHFAGYMQLPDDDQTGQSIIYQGSASQTLTPLDDKMTNVSARPSDGIVELRIAPVGDGNFAPPDFYHWHLHAALKQALPASIHLHAAPILPGSLPHPSPLPSLAGDLPDRAEITYQGGGDQELLDLKQVNALVNDNQLNADPQVVAAVQAESAQALTSMLHAANSAMPANLAFDQSDTTSLKAFVDSHDQNAAQIISAEGPYSFQSGQFVNGAAPTDPSLDVHQPTTDAFKTIDAAVTAGLNGSGVVAPTGNGLEHPSDTISVGGNIAVNNSTLVDVAGATTQLLVLGNYYQTKEIVQTNVITQSEHLDAGPSGSVSVAPNIVQNIADFSDKYTPGENSGTSDPGFHLSVDVLNGSFLDIHSLVQTNYLSNNDVIFRTSQAGESQVITGSNALVNQSMFQNLSAKYDLIVAEGNYHQADFIFQTNVLLDSNHVSLNDTTAGSQSIAAGADTAINDGSIVDLGNHNFLSAGLLGLSFAQTLAAQEGSVDAATFANLFPHLGGNINVLLVTGDYYDVNYIVQTNIVSDVNAVTLATGHGGGHGGADLSVVTGHDQTVDYAQIIDAGSSNSPYLGGHYYNDMILIQTNITSDGEKISGNDPNQLAPEIVAFTNAAEDHQQNAGHSVTPTLDVQHHVDVMSSILH